MFITKHVHELNGEWPGLSQSLQKFGETNKYNNNSTYIYSIKVR